MRAALLSLPIIFAGTLLALTADAATRIGMLECNVSPGVGMVITSSRALACVFRSRHRSERYVGTVRRFGLDIGVTGRGRLTWAVFAATWPGSGALAGEYGGASASVSAGVGVGANALVGGAANAFTLQPLSVEVQTGANIAAGVSALQLDLVPRIEHRHHLRHHPAHR